ncbi:ExeA family protein [Allorhodopirellula solitaria]|uniref:ORC1/DEAH AAA+ ATPase domain-containing protein n=1 Tax=Allorhodopirellula solitaria TaxID=2527987 RepID=A0A5C5X1P1_9BACT|nr:AAA family ATPase [Allorhodopirellula solitaria]TWT56231.1 hypothetical protein CA85_44130 [Allorhodopirellula solitaria]
MSSVETQFHVPPFPPFPSASRYLRVGSQDDALQRVRHAVEAWEAISLVIGPPGTGKSLICQVLQQYFSRDREVIVFGDTTLESPLALQRHLLSRLDRIRGIAPSPPAHGDDPQLAIIERIANSSKDFSGLLLLVDEAQSLRPDVLETIRILTNAMSDGRPRVSAVLLGGPQLDETLALPSLDALVQRVATRCYVHPLSSDETERYIRRSIEQNCEPESIEIDESAVRSVHHACSGVPRLINQLMSAAIGLAVSRQQPCITTDTVEGAWSILQQLPGPLVEEPELSRPESNVEFGPLTDECSAFESADCEEPAFEEVTSEQTASEQAAVEQAAEQDVLADDDRGQSGASQDDTVAAVAEAACHPCDQQSDPCGSADEDHESQTPEFTMQTQLGCTGDDGSQYGAVSFDCQAESDFDYDRVGAIDDSSHADPPQILSHQDACEEPIRDATPSPNDLFGDFDDEEDVRELPQDEELNHSEDIESELHREVLSLRDVATAPVLWVEDAEEDGFTHDDRDMLVIEDDVQVESTVIVEEAHCDGPDEPSMAIDFHAMLAKMRTSKHADQ